MASSKSVMSHDPLADPGGATGIDAGPVVTAPQQGGSLVMPSSLTIAEVGDFKRSLMAELERGQSVVIDCEALDVIDGAGLQLLAAVARAAAERQVELRWESPPSTLSDNLALIGLRAVVTLA